MWKICVFARYYERDPISSQEWYVAGAHPMLQVKDDVPLCFTPNGLVGLLLEPFFLRFFHKFSSLWGICDVVYWDLRPSIFDPLAPVPRSRSIAPPLNFTKRWP